MKKLLTLVLVLAFFAINLLLPTMAAEIDPKTEPSKESAPHTTEEIKEMLLEYFPEYADRIKNPRTPFSGLSLEEDIDVINKTKEISETERLTYIEKASGAAYATLFTVSRFGISQTPGTSTYTCSFEVHYLLGAGSMYISNFKYQVPPNQNDSILSTGSTNLSTASCSLVSGATRYTEINSSTPAQAVYQGVFTSNDDTTSILTKVCYLYIYVGNNNISWTTY